MDCFTDSIPNTGQKVNGWKGFLPETPQRTNRLTADITAILLFGLRHAIMYNRNNGPDKTDHIF